MNSSLRIAIIGQSNFAADVLTLLLEKRYNVVGVFTIANKGNREDILATTASQYNIPVFKFSTWRRKGVAIPEVLEQYRSVQANLNVLPYCSQFIPMEVIDGAELGSICYHPSILPRHRGASAISWTLIEGDEVAGFSIFWADDGLDTGPILLQKQCNVEPTDTLDTLYKRFLYPQGIKSMAEAVDLVAQGKAPKITQTEVNASYDPAMFKAENQYINLNQSAERIWNFIRALDSVPGALATVINDDNTEENIRLFGAHIYEDIPVKSDQFIRLKGLSTPAYIHERGLLIQGTDNRFVNVRRLKKGSKMINACDWFKQSQAPQITNFTEDELTKKEILANIWLSILKCPIEADTDFFAAGAGSMDVVRLVEECKDAFDVPLENEQVFMAPVFEEFYCEIVKALRQGSSGDNLMVHFDGFVLKANKKEIPIPTQLFINGQFVDAENRKTLDIINPANEELICQVASASSNDVDNAVKAAHQAFYGAWRQVSARQRGQLMLKLADLMEEQKEELATIESVDSGAVYTLALKTHIGMSIDAWRYFAGWCDKIQGSTIPVNPARPNNVLTFTKKEPIGVVGLVTPWNYPLMMLSWKMAACIAAGNTCLIKPAQTCGMSSVFFNKGENCIAAGRIFVEDTIHDEFVRRVVKDIQSMTIGDPLNRSTAHGPQNHRAHFEKLIDFCQRGVKEGATLVYGGKPVPNMKGYYFEPTVFTNVEDHMYIAQEESFGPIMIISKFHGSDVESVMRRANRTEYGLASGVFTKDISKALSFAENIEAGTVFVNVYNKTDVAAPFGGFKQSGFGKDLGQEALNEYLKTKCVTVEF
ncbi:cytosolic 10-formyltetrahydrofolate dehydrogenase [Lucilia cuprina]|uniref:cytosolic 10-formyltetrahydrofolate dehydrogenase n=1 Tax=Lucilia cuprina TaxID=7375 RepID=UPI001F060BC8|nr:cytosolic 10-formyltetrahydrofolate dehydrogenase [Lucilia cuprina]